MAKIIPNTFQTPNLHVDQLLPLLTEAETKILFYADRKIFGWQKDQDRISVSQFCQGTGLSIASVRKALRSLCDYRVLIKVADNDPKRNEGDCYSIQLEAEEIDVAAFLQREEARQVKDKKRMTIVRAARQEPAPTEPSPTTGDPFYPIEPSPACPIEPSPACPIEPSPACPIETQNPIKANLKPNNNEPDPLAPATPGGYKFFNRLGDEFEAKGRRRPGKFRSLASKAAFEETEKRLGEAELDKAIERVCKKGILDLVQAVDFVSAWKPGTKPARRPPTSNPSPRPEPKEARQRAQALIQAALKQGG
jgi:hypothetical protein